MKELGRDYGTANVRFYLFLDPSAKGLQEEIKRACRIADVPVIVRDAENDVKLGISRVQKALTFDILSISPTQENLIRELGVYFVLVELFHVGIVTAAPDFNLAVKCRIQRVNALISEITENVHRSHLLRSFSSSSCTGSQYLIFVHTPKIR